jgi:hypothetical protein
MLAGTAYSFPVTVNADLTEDGNAEESICVVPVPTAESSGSTELVLM